MESINAIYDGHVIKFTESVPVQGQYKVKIIFTEELNEDIEEKIQRFEKFCGTWTADDVDLIEEMISERFFFQKE